MSTMDPLRGGTRYRTYKAATAELAIWLGQKASESGVKHKDGFPISQFRAFTELVVEGSPKIDVPLEIVNTAKKAFLLRQERASLLRGIDIESDERHQHAISIMKEVYEKLRAHHQASRLAQKSDAILASKDEHEDKLLAPLFQVLELDPLGSDDDEHSDSEGASSPRKETHTKLNKNKKKKMLKDKRKAREQARHNYLREDDEDPYFVLMCLLSDLKAMRDYIKEVWQEYKDGKVDLITASLTTNATFDIIRTYEDDFPGISMLLSDYTRTIKRILSSSLDVTDECNALFFTPCTVLADVELSHLEIVGAGLAKVGEVAELIFANALYFLNGPRHVIVRRRKGKMHTIDVDLDPYGKHDYNQKREELSPASRFLDDMQILSRYAKFVYMCREFPRYTVDHFTMQWKDEFAKTGDKTVTFAQALGAQIYLDIQHTLRQYSPSGMANLYNSSLLQLKGALKWEEHLPHLLKTFKATPTMNFHPEADIQSMRATKVYVTFFTQHLQDASDKMRCEEGLFYFVDEPFSPLGNFLAANPLLCGILLFQILAAVRRAGSSIGHRCQAIQHAGQLYYSCVLQKASWKEDKKSSELWDNHLRWDDMSHLFDLTGLEAVFHGDIPATNKDIVREFGSLDDVLEKKFCTCCSPKGHYGPLEAAPCQRKQGSEPIQFAKHLCSYEAIAITHRIYFSKHMRVDCCHGHLDRVTDWTQETLQALLEQRLEKQRARNDYVTSRKVKSKKKKPITTSFRDKDGGYTQVSLLRTLKEALSDESRALRFNLLSFHITCFQLMSTLKDRMRHIFDKEDHECHCYDRNLAIFGRAIQVAVNTPERDSRLRKIHSNKDGTLFFNDGHLMIDATFRSFFAEDAIADEQVKEIDEVWGVAPR